MRVITLSTYHFENAMYIFFYKLWVTHIYKMLGEKKTDNLHFENTRYPMTSHFQNAMQQKNPK